MKKKVCKVPGCERPVTRYRDACDRCSRRLNMQMSRGVAWVLKRHNQLEVWLGGLNMIVGQSRRKK